MTLTLNQTLEAGLQLNGPEFYKIKVPEYIFTNIKWGNEIRPYQREAFGRFIYYWNEYQSKPKGVPIQLLYHMATGSGKTLIMAGLIIYLYEQGYRNFLFFVNSLNIIDKTRNNFLNISSTKYLFSDSITIGEKQIKIKEVDNFQAANQDDINIVFSTIQSLHIRLNTPKENSLTYDDFEDKRIVMISDEAHHINAETKANIVKSGLYEGQIQIEGKGLSAEEKEEILSWESTVNRIFNANFNNILLEFTATADLSVPEIAEKYNDKLLYDYPLKQFRKDGYSKEVKVLQADLSQFDRSLQGIILSQYRRKIFEKYRKLIKPVILFKSRTIKESQEFLDEFKTGIKKLCIQDIEKIKNSNPDETLVKAFNFFQISNITFENLIDELKEDFSQDKLISINSKDESEQKQLSINSLEDENNEYRAVFAVDKLNEGWDVLNLFDIVRLYDTRDSKDGRPGKTTMSEAQLIGRGARYCPFQITPDQSFFKRKFDYDVTNDLKICEELYYHSAYNPRYIQELNTALEEIGIKSKESLERQIKLKDDFKDTSFYKAGFLFLNEQLKNDRKDVYSITSTLIEQPHNFALKTGFSQSSVVFSKSESVNIEKKDKEYYLIDFGPHLVQKAINKLDFYQFSNLIKLFPNLNSISEFITSKDYLGKIKLVVSGLPEHISKLSPGEKLDATIKVLKEISEVLNSDKIEFKGSKEFKPFLLKDKIKDKSLNFTMDGGEDKEFGRSMINPVETKYPLDLIKKDWYVFNDCFGTSEEKLLIKYIDKVYDKLKSIYDEIYLVRNERFFKIYNFADGRALEPDFVLYLINKSSLYQEELHYQVFIEPKGGHLIKTDEWKEDFLQKLKDEHLLEQIYKGRKFVIWGMPFYNETLRKVEFEKSFNQLLEKS